MKYYDNGYRWRDYPDWEKRLNEPYDYTRKGLLTKLMSNKITETDNTVLKMVLSYFEGSMIFLMHYVDILKNFKNAHWKNR